MLYIQLLVCHQVCLSLYMCDFQQEDGQTDCLCLQLLTLSLLLRPILKLSSIKE